MSNNLDARNFKSTISIFILAQRLRTDISIREIKNFDQFIFLFFLCKILRSRT